MPFQEYTRELVPAFWLPRRKPDGPVVLDENHWLFDHILACIPFNDGAGPAREVRHNLSISQFGTPAWSKNFYGKAFGSVDVGMELSGDAMSSGNTEFTGLVIKFNPTTQTNDWQYVIDARNEGGTWFYVSNTNALVSYSTSTSTFTDVQSPGYVGLAHTRHGTNGSQVYAKNFTTNTLVYTAGAGDTGRAGFGTGCEFAKKTNNNTEGLRGEYLLFLALDIALTRGQIHDIWDNPAQLFRPAASYVYLDEITAAPAGAIQNQIKGANLGADLFNGTIQ